jgi:hypothetical protein
LEKKKLQGTKREMENFFKNWRGGGIVRKRERRSEREGELKPRKWEREEKSERREIFK